MVLNCHLYKTFSIKGVSEILYHMMTTGWVAGIFNKEEKTAILEELTKESGAEAENEKLWTSFQNECVSRLHVVMSLERNTLYKLTQEYPEFLTFTMLDWYHPWNENALKKVGKHFITNVKIKNNYYTTFNSVQLILISHRIHWFQTAKRMLC